MKHFLALFSLLLLAPLAAHAIAPTALKTEFLENPLAIGTSKPRFSWIVEDPARGARQTAYQVQAASSLENFDKPDLWDSGKLSSGQSHLIEYAGKPLASRQRVWWRVRTWDQDGREFSWSKPAWFEIGLLKPEDWQAKWIGNRSDHPLVDEVTEAWDRHVILTGAGYQAAKTFLDEKAEPPPHFRNEFRLPSTVARARAFICGLGYYQLYLNGRRVGDRRLDPAAAHYEKEARYVVHDITHLVREGRNAIGVILGSGWYCQLGRTTDPARPQQWGPDTGLLVQLHIELDDGRQMCVVSDKSWKTSSGPILRSELFLGEAYDASREMAGWTEAGFDDRAWAPAAEIAPLAPKLVPMLTPPERVVEVLQPVELLHPSPGIWVFDFGKLISGLTRLKIRSSKPITVIQRYAEAAGGHPTDAFPIVRTKFYYPQDIAPSKGMILASQSVHLPGSASGTPVYLYVTAGRGQELYEPTSFTYQPFRYVEVLGLADAPRLGDMEALFIHSDLKPTGSFVCSDEKVNRVYELMHRTLRACLHGVLQDNPGQERGGWMGENQATFEFLAFACDTAQFHRQYIRDIEAGTLPDGRPPRVTPNFRSKYGGGDIGWEATTGLMLSRHHLFYGDRRLQNEHYDYVKRYVELYRPLAETNLDGFVGFGDWLDPWPTLHGVRKSVDRAGQSSTDSGWPVNSPQQVTVGGLYYGAVVALVEAARALGKAGDLARYTRLASLMRENYNKRFYDAERKTYGSQAGNLLALTYGLVPDGDAATVAASLDHNVRLDWKGHLSTGHVTTSLLPSTLSSYGYAETALQLFRNDDYPSWGFMLSKGQTGIPPRWRNTARPDLANYGRMLQQALGAAGRWFYDSLGGIQPDPDHPGFKHFILRPSVPQGLDWVKVKYESVYGLIRSEWQGDGGALTWQITIPWNTTATAKFPDGTTKRLEAGRHTLTIPEPRKP